jgi:hypothetical protein
MVSCKTQSGGHRGLVGGQATSPSWQGRTHESFVSHRIRSTVRDRVGTELVRWPGDDDEVLDAPQLAEIVLMCLRISDVLGFNTDLEWVGDGQGLALLQAPAMLTSG